MKPHPDGRRRRQQAVPAPATGRAGAGTHFQGGISDAGVRDSGSIRGSAGGYDALRWATREARDRGTRLTAFLASDLAPPGQVTLRDAKRRPANRGERLLAEGLSYAESVAGTASMEVGVTDQPPAQALCERSKTRK